MIRPTYPLPIRVAALCLGAALSLAASAAETYLPAVGGTGGGQYLAPCPDGESLAGLELRAADDVDAIRPLCVTAYGPRTATMPQLTVGSGLVQHYASANREVIAQYSEFLGDWSSLPDGWHGGTGGRLTSVVCPSARPVVIGLFVAAEGVDTVVVNNIHLFCGLAAPAQVLDPNPSAIFDGPGYKPSSATFGIGAGGATPNVTSAYQRCADGQIAVGIHGRSGIWLDALGLICDAPRYARSVAGTPVLSLGRVSSPSTAAGPARPICDAAREARARSSPAAPGLEAQCAAFMNAHAVKTLGRVTGAPAASGPAPTICDAARAARARNSPAAAGLEEQCRRSPPVPAAPAPLSAQTLDDLAGVGLAIAGSDPGVAAARDANPDRFFQLGFDIASGIFGDPALGARGNTAVGPGSLGIRSMLSAVGQAGFDAAVTLHLGRKYR